MMIERVRLSVENWNPCRKLTLGDDGGYGGGGYCDAVVAALEYDEEEQRQGPSLDRKDGGL